MIYFYCEDHSEKYFKDYLDSIMANYSDQIILIRDWQCLPFLEVTDIVIYMQQLPKELDVMKEVKVAKQFLLNTEQLSQPNCLEKMRAIPCQIEIIDYSLANMVYLTNGETGSRRVHYLPYMVNPLEIYPEIEKTDGIAVTGCWNSPRRSHIKSLLALSGLPVSVVGGFGFSERDSVLFKHRILLNVHYSPDYRIFEQFRCNRCILNRMIVISETSEDVDFELRPYMIECPYSDLVEVAMKVMENYDEVYAQLFATFDLDAISAKYREVANLEGLFV
jgi:hypothetical protein